MYTNIYEKQSILPDNLEETTIKDLLDFEEWVYTVPWAMVADESGRLWIDGGYGFSKIPGGTFSMAIKKQGDYILVRKDTINDYKYKRRDLYSAHVGSYEENYLPVILE